MSGWTKGIFIKHNHHAVIVSHHLCTALPGVYRGVCNVVITAMVDVWIQERCALPLYRRRRGLQCSCISDDGSRLHAGGGFQSMMTNTGRCWAVPTEYGHYNTSDRQGDRCSTLAICGPRLWRGHRRWLDSLMMKCPPQQVLDFQRQSVCPWLVSMHSGVEVPEFIINFRRR